MSEDRRNQIGRGYQFDRYGVSELVTILQRRVEWAMHPEVVEPKQLDEIADVAAGDARVAINILRNAARLAETAGEGQITWDAISEAVPEARAEIRQKNLDQLKPHQRELYHLIEEAGEIAPGDLYDQYAETVDDPKSDRTMRNYLKKMRQYNLVEAVGEKRSRTYRVVG